MGIDGDGTVAAKSEMQAQHMIYNMINLIKQTGSNDNIIINGLITNHFEQCYSDICNCSDLIIEFE